MQPGCRCRWFDGRAQSPYLSPACSRMHALTFMPPDSYPTATHFCHLSTGGSTFCEWKGTACYWDVLPPGGQAGSALQRVAWSYEEPTPAFRTIAGRLAFYARPPLECWVGEERVQPQVRGGQAVLQCACLGAACSMPQPRGIARLALAPLKLGSAAASAALLLAAASHVSHEPTFICAGGAVLWRLGDPQHRRAVQGRPRHRRLVRQPGIPLVQALCTCASSATAAAAASRSSKTGLLRSTCSVSFQWPRYGM